MSKPFMMLYVADYLADTTHLSTEQHGAYLLILFALWRRGGFVPADERVLSKLAGLSLKRWRQTGAPIIALLDVQGEKITQRRLLSELQKTQVTSEVRRAAAYRSHEARSLKAHDPAHANAPSLHQKSGVQTGGNQNHIHNHKGKKKEPPAVAGASVAVVAVVPLPPWISPEAWTGYSDMRRRKRAPMTERAKTLVIKELEQLKLRGHDPNAVLDQSTQNGWTGVFELKSKSTKHEQQSSHTRFLSAAASLIDEQFAIAADAREDGGNFGSLDGAGRALPSLEHDGRSEPSVS